MDHILYQIFKITLIMSYKKHREKTDNVSIRIYVNKIENTITFRIRTGYYREILMAEQWNCLEVLKVR